MSQIPDPRIANIVYNFLGNTLAQLNEIDKNNLGSSSLKAVKTDPKNVFSMSHDPSMNLLPSAPMDMPLPPVQQPAAPAIPQATVVAAPAHNVVNAGINVQPEPQIIVNKIQLKNAPSIKEEVDKIITALSNIKNLLDE